MVVRRIHKIQLLGWLLGLFLGKAGRELGLASTDGSAWADPPQPCAVIAGSKHFTLMNPMGCLYNLFGLISKPNDGTIALEETKLGQGLMTDFCSVYVGHNTIKDHPDVLEATVNFILHQRFDVV